MNNYIHLRQKLLEKSQSLITVYASADTPHNPREYRKNLAEDLKNSTGQWFNPLDNGSLPYQNWGSGNDFPQIATQINLRNPVSFGLINTKTDFVVGKKIVTYYERIDDKGDTLITDIVNIDEIDDWLEQNEMLHQLTKATFDYLLLGNCFFEATTSLDRKKIMYLRHRDPNLIRVGQAQNENIRNYALSDFSGGGVFYAPLQYLPVFKREDCQPNKIPYANSLMHIKNYLPGAFYYGVPDWMGAQKFVELLNEIPVFHLAGMSNAYYLRWHIQIPEDYFSSQYTSSEDIEKAETALQSQMDAFLAGSANNGKSFITRFGRDHMGKPIEGVKIEALKPELYDEAYVELFNQGMIAVCSAHGINPSLAGVILNGQLSAGSEIRNAYNMYLQLKVPRFREAILRALNYVKYANGWDQKYKDKNGGRLRFGMIGHQITKLDENTEGGKDVTQ